MSEEPPPPPPPPPLQYPVAPSRSSSRTGVFIAIVAAVTLLTVAGIAVGVALVGVGALKRAAAAPQPLTQATAVTANRGAVVFADDFHDSKSGWSTETLPSGTNFAYAATGYVIVAKGSLDHYAASPYRTPVQQVAISVTATQSSDAPVGAGYGVSCWRGTDTSELRYDFIVTAAGDWEVDRRDGGTPAKPVVVKQGKSSAVLGSMPVAVQGMCAALADLHTIRLLLFAGSQRIADFTDTATPLPGAGWLPDLIVTSSTIRASTVTLTRFEVRDLTR